RCLDRTEGPQGQREGIASPARSCWPLAPPSLSPSFQFPPRRSFSASRYLASSRPTREPFERRSSSTDFACSPCISALATTHRSRTFICSFGIPPPCLLPFLPAAGFLAPLHLSKLHPVHLSEPDPYHPCFCSRWVGGVGLTKGARRGAFAAEVQRGQVRQ